MLYIHGGWPKTGTTSLQAALVRQRGALTAAGIVYPDWWMDGASHNGLAHMLHDADRLDAALADFDRFLAAQDGSDVLFSSESLFFFLKEERTQRPLLRLLETAARRAPVKVAWTVRRVDDLLRSLYGHLTIAGVDLTPPETLAEEFRPEPLLAGLRAVEAVAEVGYVEYDAGGHETELLAELGVPADAAAAIEEDLRANPRLNVGLSEKQAAVVLAPEARAKWADGMADKSTLLKAFRRGELQFEDDRHWELIGEGPGRRLHEKMLRASLESGFEPYPRFFGVPAPSGL
jgi:hypothetical protein